MINGADFQIPISILYLWLFLLLGTACTPYVPEDFLRRTTGPSPYGEYQEDAVHYFIEIGLGSELGPSTPIVRKWNSDIRIQVQGSYTQADLTELENIISELAELTGLSITRTTNNPNMHIHFIEQSNFSKYVSTVRGLPTQLGAFEVFPNAEHIIYKAVMVIPYDLTGALRSHILREELTQCLGLKKDSYRYPDSIFQQSPEYVPTQYADIDREIIRILYDSRIRPGMTEAEVLNALSVPTSQQTLTTAQQQ